MSKTKDNNEFDTEREALTGEDFDAWKVELGDNQKDYSGMTMGNYLFLYPVLYDSYHSFSSLPSKGWLCKNTANGKYKVILNLNASQMYIKYCSNSSYLGMKFIAEDMKYCKFNLEDFKNECVEEIDKMDSSLKDFYNGLDVNLESRCLKNMEINLAFFESLNRESFNEELNRVVQKYHFKEIGDVSSYKKCLYLAVLDEYKQFYVGKCAGGLKNRMRKHWVAKVIPGRQLWVGSNDYSRVKYDNFQMLDTTRIFVCEDIKAIVEENSSEANNPNIVWQNTFGIKPLFEEMTDLDKAERIVINNSKCMYTLSDRVPLLDFDKYDELCKKYNLSKDELLIKHYLEM